MEKMGQIHRKAVEYVNNGWSVIPIGLDKRPDFNKLPFNEYGERSWAEYQEHQPNEATLNSWFINTPSTSLAVVTGEISKLIVIDLDSVEMYRLARVAVPLLNSTATVSTGRGYHCYLNVADRNYPTLKFTRDGITNHIKGDGGYVVAPPSVHPSGRLYEWANSRPVATIASVNVLIQLLNQVGFEFKGGKQEKPADWYEELFENTYSTGERMTAAQSLTGLLRRYVPDKPGLVYHLVSLWNEGNCQPPLDERDIKNIVKSYFQLYED